MELMNLSELREFVNLYEVKLHTDCKRSFNIKFNQMLITKPVQSRVNINNSRSTQITILIFILIIMSL